METGELEIAAVSAAQGQIAALGVARRMVDTLKASNDAHWKALDVEAAEVKLRGILREATDFATFKLRAPLPRPRARIVAKDKEGVRGLPDVMRRRALMGNPALGAAETQSSAVGNVIALVEELFFSVLLGMTGGSEESSVRSLGDDAAFYLLRDGIMRLFNDHIRGWAVSESTTEKMNYLAAYPAAHFGSDKGAENQAAHEKMKEERSRFLLEKGLVNGHLGLLAMSEAYDWNGSDLADRIPETKSAAILQRRSGPSGHATFDAANGRVYLQMEAVTRFSRSLFSSLHLPAVPRRQSDGATEDNSATLPLTAADVALAFEVPHASFIDLGLGTLPWTHFAPMTFSDEELTKMNKEGHLPRNIEGCLAFNRTRLAKVTEETEPLEEPPLEKSEAHFQVKNALASVGLYSAGEERTPLPTGPLVDALRRVAAAMAPRGGKIHAYIESQKPSSSSSSSSVTPEEWLLRVLLITSGVETVARMDAVEPLPDLTTAEKTHLNKVLTAVFFRDVIHLIIEQLMTGAVPGRTTEPTETWKDSMNAVVTAASAAMKELEEEYPAWLTQIDDLILGALTYGGYGPISCWLTTLPLYPVLTKETLTIELVRLAARARLRQRILATHIVRRREATPPPGLVTRTYRGVKRVVWDIAMSARGMFSRGKEEPEPSDETLSSENEWAEMERLFGDHLEEDAVAALGDLRVGDALYASILHALSIPHDAATAHSFCKRVGRLRGIGGPALVKVLEISAAHNDGGKAMGPVEIASGNLAAILSITLYLLNYPRKKLKMLHGRLGKRPLLLEAVEAIEAILSKYKRSELQPKAGSVWSLADFITKKQEAPFTQLVAHLAADLPGNVLHNGMFIRCAIRDLLSRENNLIIRA